jgi:hypothetical protein
MKKFIAGFIVGIFLCLGAVFFLYRGGVARLDLGRALDKDMIILGNGTVLRGWILKRENNEIFMEFEDKGRMNIPEGHCKNIQENYNYKYLRGMS